MARFTRFEEIEAWKLARELANLVYDFCEHPSLRYDFGFKDQIRRASASIMFNIAEGFDSGNNRIFRRHLVIAKASAGEVKSQLYLAHDRRYISNEECAAAMKLTDMISRQISNLAHYLSEDAKSR